MADTRQRMDEVVEGATSKAEKIRRLDAAGYSRVEIRDYLGVRYQHVRNVLVEDAPLVVAEDAPPPYARLVVGADGTLVVPRALVRALGAGPRDAVLFETDAAGVHLLGAAAGVRFAQRLLAGQIADDAAWGADALIADRRAEVRRG